jgi:hypothetical protein
MEHEDIHSQLKEAKAEMEHAHRGSYQASALNWTYRRFVEVRQRYWELLDELRAESEEARKILEGIFSKLES